jgi:hypothetical protein
MARRLRWPVRSIMAGTAGTATMTAAYAAEHRVRTRVLGQLDYDDGLVPGQIVASILHLPQVTHRQERELGLILRWSYGSAFGLMHGALRRAKGEPFASMVFGGMLMTATFTLFRDRRVARDRPVLGRPHRRGPALALDRVTHPLMRSAARRPSCLHSATHDLAVQIASSRRVQYHGSTEASRGLE